MQLVSAIMVTGKDASRRDLALQAIECFRQQTWPFRELVIVNDGEPLIECYTPMLREIKVEYSPANTLGDLRNIGLDNAKGAWIVQWDDDDWYSPERISYMMAYAKTNSAVLLRHQIRYSFDLDVAFVMTWPSHWKTPGIPGTVLHSATAGRYQQLAKAEDEYFLLDNFGGRIIVADNQDGRRTGHGPEMYVRLEHGHNTWDKSHILGNAARLTQGTWNLSSYEEGCLKSVLQNYPNFYKKKVEPTRQP